MTARTKVPAPDTTPAAPSPALDELTGSMPRLVAVPLDLLDPHPDNPRKSVEDEDLTDLVDSIATQGLLEPLVVVPSPDDPDRYRTIAGHRRAAAASRAGLLTVPAIVRDHMTPVQQLEAMLVENLRRTDLTPVEEADGYQGLLDLGLTRQDVSDRTGTKPATLRARLALVTLPAPARAAVQAHQASLEDAAALAKVLARKDLREDDTEKLTAAFGRPGFAHVVQTTTYELTIAAAFAKACQKAEDAGLRVLDAKHWDLPKGTASLSYLTDDAPGTYGHAIDPEGHKSCPGHAVVLTATYQGTALSIPVCEGWASHGHRKAGVLAAAADEAPDPEAHRAKIANNKAGVSATTVRRAWIRDHLLGTGLAAKSPTDAALYAVRVLQAQPTPEYSERGVLAEFGADTPALTGPAALRQLVAIAAARVEAIIARDKSWWSPDFYTAGTVAHHLQALAAWGYELADVEQAAVTAHSERVAAAAAAKAAARDEGSDAAEPPATPNGDANDDESDDEYFDEDES